MQQSSNPTPHPSPQGTNDQGKTIAIIAYITLIGFIIALVMHSSNKTSIARFHLRQVVGLLFCGVGMIILIFIPFLGWVLYPLVGIALFVFWIMGLIAAINGEEKPMPLVGEFFNKTFTFID